MLSLKIKAFYCITSILINKEQVLFNFSRNQSIDLILISFIDLTFVRLIQLIIIIYLFKIWFVHFLLILFIDLFVFLFFKVIVQVFILFLLVIVQNIWLTVNNRLKNIVFAYNSNFLRIQRIWLILKLF